jgi:hypothetical protein
MVGDNAVAPSITNEDCLENRLKEATAEDSRQLLEEFLKAFYLDESEVAVVDRRPSALSDPTEGSDVQRSDDRIMPLTRPKRDYHDYKHSKYPPAAARLGILHS